MSEIQNIEAEDRDPIDKLASLFVSDALLASQFNDLRRASADEPMARLWCAVLEDSLRCLLDGAGADPRSRRFRQHELARAWIFEGGGQLTFNDICDGLGIDQEYFRQHLACVEIYGLPGGAENLPRRAPIINGHDKIIYGEQQWRSHGPSFKRVHGRAGQRV